MSQFVVPPKPAMRTLTTVTVLVRDYDEAVAWYRKKLGFLPLQDVDLGGGKRWLVVAPAAGRGAKLLLAKAEGEAQLARVGDQAGGRVFLFLETDNFARDHKTMQERDVVFREAPRHEAYGTVAVFEDLYGNLWDLIEPRR